MNLVKHLMTAEKRQRTTDQKPDRTTAMLQIIEQVKQEFPLYESETFVCGPDGSCLGCPKKLLELVDSELSYWEAAISNGQTPQFDEIRRFGKLCTNVKRGLDRNGVLEKYQQLKSADLKPTGKP
ncbi:hypothetical protein L2719_11110 [Shewanella schlegeliana]|uniref:Oxidoreductase-like domain-containing protein n=1 Tax=Shewanella schlegeliana TaxID=190308 RepID=A0ABS1STU1_9GAMM|nr:hypothetical protein [Shewanella schlegeliana]MBL4911951.1 hypothetical protein [Shewanella schlegeliana]MCL1110096.1 hypothetical protein [Shewanella schlegeliana]GIU26734.1 hypothetical protein TUM4433_12900 [Shewanella schlegeliana]